MKYTFGRSSKAKLDTCHPKLVEIAALALKRSPYDFTIVHGWRGKEVQNALFDSNASTKQFPHSMHNNVDQRSRPCSLAIDFAPWVKGKIPWNDTHIFAIIAGCFHSSAIELEETVRYGGDWDSDGSTKDQTLMDWGHFEILL